MFYSISSTSIKHTVVVLGVAYGGSRAAQILAKDLPKGWRIVLIDRNTHANHVYIIPRLTVLPGHEHKAFIPYEKVFLDPVSDPVPTRVRLQATITSLSPHSLTLSRSFPEHGIIPDSEGKNTLHFDYAIYALGSHLPAPLNFWDPSHSLTTDLSNNSESKTVNGYNGTKAEGITFLKKAQVTIENSQSILVVGGGALGIQFATDIAAIYPSKNVTLLHSRRRLLPRFDPAMHTEVMQSLESLNVDVILGERLDLDSARADKPTLNASGQRIIRTMTGREIAADLLLLCTGQTPNTQLLKNMDSTTVDSDNNMAKVLRTLQLASVPPVLEEKLSPSGAVSEASQIEAALEHLTLTDTCTDSGISNQDQATPLTAPFTTEEEESEEEINLVTPYPHIFVIGDAADAFGALHAGHNAYFQAEVAARNVLRLIRNQERLSDKEEEALELYSPIPPGIKVSLGLTKSVYQINGVVGVNSNPKDHPEDLNAAAVWFYFGQNVQKEEDMLA